VIDGIFRGMEMGSFTKERYQQAEEASAAFNKLTGHGDVGVGTEEAFQLLQERVEQGDGEAMWLLGLCREHGIGVKKDVQIAECLYGFSREAGAPLGYLLMKNCKKGSDTFELKDFGLSCHCSSFRANHCKERLSFA